MKKKFLTFLAFLLFIAFNLSSQDSFQLLFQSANNKRPFFVKEEISGTLLLVGIEFDPIDSLYKNKIWKISTNGDTSSFHIDFGSVQSSFNYIERLSDNNYIIIGSSSDSADVYSGNLLNILWTDSNFHRLSVKTYSFVNFKEIILKEIVKDDFGYYVVGQISQPNIPNRYYPLFIRINNNGDTLRTSIYNTFYGSQPIFNAIFNPDSSSIWWFSGGYPSMYGRLTRRISDTLFNYISDDTLMFRVIGNMFAKKINDTSFLFSSIYLIDGGYPNDQDIGISKYNNNLETIAFDHFGAVDTIDYPGRFQGIDFKNDDTLYYTGTKNVIVSFNPIGPSWILIGQLDHNLQLRYQRIYGGDKYYMPLHVIATRDGGCLVNSLVHNHDLDVDDILVMKLNPEGLITGTGSLIAPLRHAIVWPNPAMDILNVEYTEQEGELSIIDINGRMMHWQKIQEGRNIINISHLNPGFYFYQIRLQNQETQSGKFIKL